MGKKESWFSVIKRVFTPSSKDKLSDNTEKNYTKEKKKKGLGKLKHADSFIPLFREPSSIEKILGEADQVYRPIEFRPLTTFDQASTPSFAPSRAATPLQDPWTPKTSVLLASPPRVSSSRRVDSPPRVSSSRRVDSPPRVSSSRKADSPPRVRTPEKVATPTKASTSQRLVSSPKSAIPPKSNSTEPRVRTPEKVATPTKASTSQRLVSSPKSAIPPKSNSTEPPVTDPSIAAPREVTSSSQAAITSKAARLTKGSTSQRLLSSLKSATPPKSTTHERSVSIPSSASPREVASSSRPSTPSKPARPATPPTSNSSRFVYRPRPESTLNDQHVCATRIQAAYRGHKSRKNYRSLRGLARLQTVVKGQSAKRQTANAMRSMQLMVRVQTQIQSRRIEMLEKRALQLQALESQDLNQGTENGNPDGWDDSRLTKHEVDTRTQRKSEAVIKRERAMAYAYSHQSWKKNPKAPQAALMDIRASGGFPWWWSWMDRQTNPAIMPTKPSGSPSVKNFRSTPPRATTSSPLIPASSSLGFDNNSATGTPRSTRSVAMPTRMRMSLTPPSRIFSNKFMRSRPTGSNYSPFKDDDSLMSCPPFSGPRYMEPTASTVAKARGGSGVSPDIQSKRRVSFPLAQGVGPFKWNRRGSSSAATTPGRDGGLGKPLERKPSMQSIGNMSVNSAVSMPAGLGRKPFNRFV